ncbi:hypothetical protein B0G66_12716 [Bacillus badius]|nr:hypothetical protein B0G66_12716 [Bacillus badius]
MASVTKREKILFALWWNLVMTEKEKEIARFSI